MTTELKPWEVVLPISGKFARMRRPTLGDVLLTLLVPRPGVPPHAALAELLVTIDGEPLTAQTFLEMDLEEAAPIVQESTKRLNVIQHAKGVA